MVHSTAPVLLQAETGRNPHKGDNWQFTKEARGVSIQRFCNLAPVVDYHILSEAKSIVLTSSMIIIDF
jgi:hypothetical protein